MRHKFLLIVLLFGCLLLKASSPEGNVHLNILLRRIYFYLDFDKIEKADSLQREALALFSELGAKNDVSTIHSMNTIAHKYSEKGMYGKALVAKKAVITVQGMVSPTDNVEMSLDYSDMAYYQQELGDYDDALTSIKESLRFAQNLDDADVFSVYIRAAELFFNAIPPQIDSSIIFQKRSLKYLAKLYGEESPYYIEELYYLAKYYDAANDFSSASDTYLTVLKYRANNMSEGQDMTDLLPILDRAIICSNKSGKQERSNTLKEMAMEMSVLQIAEQLSNKAYLSDFPSHADSLEFTSLEEKCSLEPDFISSYPNSYAKAAYLFYMAFKEVLKQQPESAINYGIAVKSICDSLRIITPLYVENLCVLANAYYDMSRPAQAYKYALDALNLREDYLPPKNNFYFGIYHDLCTYAAAIGNSREALKYAVESVKCRKYLKYSSSPYGYFSDVDLLAACYEDSGNYSKALGIRENLIDEIKAYDPSILDFPGNQFQLNLASSYLQNRQYDKALEEANEVLKQRRLYGTAELMANACGLISNIYRMKGDFDNSLKYALESYNLLRGESNVNDNSIFRSLRELSYNYYLCNDWVKANHVGDDAAELARNIIIESFADLNYEDRISYWQSYSAFFEREYPNYVVESHTEDVSGLYNYTALFSKGLILNTYTELAKTINASGDASSIAKYHKLLSVRRKLSSFLSGKEYVKKSVIDSIRVEQARLEREVMIECQEYGNYTRNLRYTWQDVQASLEDRDMAIEFISYHSLEDGDKYIYAALTLKKDDIAPHLTILFEETDILPLLKRYLKNNGLYIKVWKPLEPLLEGVDNVYFSPAGKLYGLNIEVLPRIFGNDNSRMYYRLSSTRELAEEPMRISAGDAVVYGGIDYETSIDEMAEIDTPFSNESSQVRGFIIPIDSLNIRSGWDYLPGTLKEAKSIEKIMRRVHRKVSVLTGSNGTESSIKALDGTTSRLLHIATHGFYFAESDSIKMQKASLDIIHDGVDYKSHTYYEDKSLTRSGLLMAGCNNILQGADISFSTDDGVLFAKEIADIDLKGIDLVTLSSCDSGLGDIAGDGVFGLQRAFKKAGVNSLLMSLWQVNDEATQILMSRFYENMLVRKMTKSNSLLEAQDYVSKYDNGKFSDPYYWAAFVLLDGR